MVLRRSSLRELVLEKLALESYVFHRCLLLQPALTAQQRLRRRVGVSIVREIVPSRVAFFLTQQLVDMSHRRWSGLGGFALEVSNIHSLAAAVCISIKLHPRRDPYMAP